MINPEQEGEIITRVKFSLDDYEFYFKFADERMLTMQDLIVESLRNYVGVKEEVGRQQGLQDNHEMLDEIGATPIHSNEPINLTEYRSKK